MARSKKNPIITHNMSHDSQAEADILEFFKELELIGYIDSIKRGDTITLSSPVKRKYIDNSKKKSKELEETFIRECTYSCDFEVKLNNNSYKLPIFKDINTTEKLNKKGVFVFLAQNNIVRIEVKGTTFRYNNSGVEKFMIIQKWLWEKENIYVNIIQPDKLFPITFTPKEYQLTPKNREIRKLKWKVTQLEDYINQYGK